MRGNRKNNIAVKRKKSVASNQKPSQQISTQIQQYSGPIPPAIELSKYKEILPTAPERILNMAEKDQSNSINIQQKIIEYTHKEKRLGQILAFVSILLAFALGFYALNKNYPIIASIICGFTITSILAAYVLGKLFVGKSSKET